jgi:RNA polymerase sigma-70 factor (ECF subfamily)
MTEQEFSGVYKTYVNSIYVLCYSFMKNKADTEDAVQETFIRFLKNDDLFTSDEHLKAWLIVTASNVCKSALKKWWKTRRDDMPEVILPQTVDKEKRQLLEAVMELPEKYKTAIYLHYYEGYSTSEIAKMTGTSESNARTLLKRGREKLKEILGET